MFNFKFNSTYLKKIFRNAAKTSYQYFVASKVDSVFIDLVHLCISNIPVFVVFFVFFRVFPNLKGIQLSFRTNLGFISEIYAPVKKINERRNNLIYTYLTCTCITN